MSSKKQLTNQPKTAINEKQTQNLNLSSNQFDNVNNTPKHSHVGAGRVRRDSSKFSKSNDSIQQTKENIIKSTVYDYFKNKWTGESLLENIADFNLNLEEEHNLWKLINQNIKNQTANNETEVVSTRSEENTSPEIQTRKKCDRPILARQSLESQGSGLCMKVHSGQNLDSQCTSMRNSQEDVELRDTNLPKENMDNNHQNLDESQKNLQEEEYVQTGLSAAQETVILQYLLRAVNQIIEEDNISKNSTDRDTNLEVQIISDSSTPSSQPSQESGEIKESGEDPCEIIVQKTSEKTTYNKDRNTNSKVGRTSPNKPCNNTDKKQMAFVSNDKNCLSVNWELDGDELTCSMLEDNKDKEDLIEDSSSHNSPGQDEQYNRSVLCPMNDRYGPFFIHRDYVDIDLYQKGLLYENWNPAQALNEICNNCSWGVPEFREISYIKDRGFVYSVILKGHEFKPEKRASTKKKAKMFGSAFVLQCLGFKLNNCEEFYNVRSSYNPLENCRYERINEDFSKAYLKYEPESPPYYKKGYSTELESYRTLKSNVHSRKRSYSSGSEKKSQYNVKKERVYSKKTEPRSYYNTDLDKYKHNSSNELHDTSNESTPQKSKSKSKSKRGHSPKSKKKYKKITMLVLKKSKNPNKKTSSSDELEDSYYFSPRKLNKKLKYKKIHIADSSKTTKHNKSYKPISKQNTKILKRYQNKSDSSDEYSSDDSKKNSKYKIINRHESKIRSRDKKNNHSKQKIKIKKEKYDESDDPSDQRSSGESRIKPNHKRVHSPEYKESNIYCDSNSGSVHRPVVPAIHAEPTIQQPLNQSTVNHPTVIKYQIDHTQNTVTAYENSGLNYSTNTYGSSSSYALQFPYGQYQERTMPYGQFQESPMHTYPPHPYQNLYLYNPTSGYRY